MTQPLPGNAGAYDLDDLLRSIEAEAAQLVADNRWGSREDAELEERFEAAAVAALRVPRFAERSRLLRQIARRVVPTRLRPLLKACIRLGERAMRVAYRRTLGR